MKYSFPQIRLIEKTLITVRLNFIVGILNNLKTRKNLKKFKKNKFRALEIGPGNEPILGFETLNILNGHHIHYIHDISKGLDIFEDNSFDIVYISHLLEHLPWYSLKNILLDLNRVLKPKGYLEVWVPDAYKICKILVQYEENGLDDSHNDGWYRFNEEKNPIKWAAGRLFSYGDGDGGLYHHNYHRGLFTEKYLIELFESCGFFNVVKMNLDEVRGFNHGWINLGVKGMK